MHRRYRTPSTVSYLFVSSFSDIEQFTSEREHSVLVSSHYTKSRHSQ
jgi:hypothetical protein